MSLIKKQINLPLLILIGFNLKEPSLLVRNLNLSERGGEEKYRDKKTDKSMIIRGP